MEPRSSSALLHVLVLKRFILNYDCYYFDKAFCDTILQVKESKDKAMSVLNSYRIAGSHDFVHDSNLPSQQDTEIGPLPFVSLLEFVSEIYQVCFTINVALKEFQTKECSLVSS